MRCFSNKELVKEINIITVAHHRGEISKREALVSLYRLSSRCKREFSWGCGRISYLSNHRQLMMVATAMLAVFNR
jgi:hypothetical protein